MDNTNGKRKRPVKSIGNNWINRHTYKPTPTVKTWGKTHEDFQPDGTMSIRQMVQRYQQGMSVPVNAVEYFEGETLHPSADLTEKAEFVQRYSNIASSEIVQQRPPDDARGGTGEDATSPDET